jgi:hypothetical protein
MSATPCITAQFSGGRKSATVEFCAIPFPGYESEYEYPKITSGLFQIISAYRRDNRYDKWQRILEGNTASQRIEYQCLISSTPSKDDNFESYQLLDDSFMICNKGEVVWNR